MLIFTFHPLPYKTEFLNSESLSPFRTVIVNEMTLTH